MKAQQKKVYADKNNQQVNQQPDPAASAIAPAAGLDKPGAEDHVEALIDEAVEESFPCSDAPAFGCAKEAAAKKN